MFYFSYTIKVNIYRFFRTWIFKNNCNIFYLLSDYHWNCAFACMINVHTIFNQYQGCFFCIKAIFIYKECYNKWCISLFLNLFYSLQMCSFICANCVVIKRWNCICQSRLKIAALGCNNFFQIWNLWLSFMRTLHL